MIKDEYGQMMIIGAFLLAMTVAVIMLMLNNVIYSSNVAYEGSMDQSRYDDISYRQATANEAAYASTSDDSMYIIHMADFEKSLNNLSSIRGKYIDLYSQNYTHTPLTTPFDATYTNTTLSIFGKRSNAYYYIYTGADKSLNGYAPPSSFSSTKYKIYLSQNKTSMVTGSDRVMLMINITDENYIGQPNVAFTFNQDPNGLGTIVTPDDQSPGGTTDLYGGLILYYKNTNIHSSGVVNISVTAGSNVSNTIQIYCIAGDSVGNGGYNGDVPYTIELGPVITNNHGHGTVNTQTITIKFNFTNFENANIRNNDINEVYYSPNVQRISSPPNFDSSTGSIGFTISRSDLNSYTIKIQVRVTAMYTGVTPSTPYDKTYIITING